MANRKVFSVGLGGGCHWCTEGVFQSLKGVIEVKQGWISSLGENNSFSEGILVEFNSNEISLENLIEIHLHTHSCTSNHSFRDKYRSAIYVFDDNQKNRCEQLLVKFQFNFEKKIITKVLNFYEFKLNDEEYLNYLYSKENNKFCKTYIHPKLSLLLDKFSNKVLVDKVKRLIN